MINLILETEGLNYIVQIMLQIFAFVSLINIDPSPFFAGCYCGKHNALLLLNIQNLSNFSFGVKGNFSFGVKRTENIFACVIKC